MMPLVMLGSGEKRTIQKINGRDDTKRFLESMGFVPGSSVTVVSQMGGSMILSVKDARVALDQSMAMRIIV